MTTFYSPDARELKVGPGRSNPSLAPGERDREAAAGDSTRVVRFRKGFATVALDDPLREEKLAWIESARSRYGIVDLGEEDGGNAATCPECGKTVATAFALKGHLRTHATG